MVCGVRVYCIVACVCVCVCVCVCTRARVRSDAGQSVLLANKRRYFCSCCILDIHVKKKTKKTKKQKKCKCQVSFLRRFMVPSILKVVVRLCVCAWLGKILQPSLSS